jgi:predicted porin
MTRTLRSTTALVSATLAGAAVAALPGGAAAQGLKLGLGGYFDYFVTAVSQDDGVGRPGQGKRNFDIKREAEVWFTGSVKLENGLTVGARIELEAETCGDQIDESFIFFSGNWGRVELGALNSALYRMHYSAPAIIPGHGPVDSSFAEASGGSNRLASSSIATNSAGTLTSDSEKFSYYTPRMGNVQLGFSWTPDQSEEVTGGMNARNGSFGGMTNSNNAAQYENIFELGANYVDKMGPVEINLSLGWGHGKLEQSTTNYKNSRDFYAVGANVMWQGFTFGGSFAHDTAFQTNTAVGIVPAGTYKARYWTAGVDYKTGPWAYGFTYSGGRIEGPSGVSDDRLDQYQLATRYTFGPGMQLVGAVQYVDFRGPDKTPTTTGNDSTNKAWVLLLGTRISF